MVQNKYHGTKKCTNWLIERVSITVKTGVLGCEKCFKKAKQTIFSAVDFSVIGKRYIVSKIKIRYILGQS